MFGGYAMKSIFRKFLALLLCTALCLGLVPAAWADEETAVSLIDYDDTDIIDNDIWPNPPEPLADQDFLISDNEVFSAGTYNAVLAAEYANKWWDSFNPDWYNWESEGYGDCTNFVSQCLYAGGMPMTSGWYWNSRTNYNYSGSWTIPQELANYLRSQGYNIIVSPSVSQVSAGDVIFYDWGADGRWDHSAICVGASGSTRYVCAHSNAAGNGYTSWTMGASRYAVAQLSGSMEIPRPGKASLIGLSGNTFAASSPVTFSWNATSNSTHYNLWIDKSDSSGTYSYYEHIREIKGTSWSLTLSAGSYRAQVNAYNSNYNEPDGSDWAHTTGDYVYFTVKDATYTVSYNANGGYNAPQSQIKTFGKALTLSSQEPQRDSTGAGAYTVTFNPNGGSVSTTSLSAPKTTYYYFRNWNTKSDGSGTNYSRGEKYYADESTTLYAMWDAVTSLSRVVLPTPTRSGYTFMGWATSSSASSGVTGEYCPHRNETLYATWERTGIASGTWDNLNWHLGFNGCLSISGSGTMKSHYYDSDEAWLAYKDSITKVVINEGVTSVSEFAFSECRSLTSISFPQSVTEIKMGAFFGCTALKKVTLSASITFLGTEAFVDCPFETAGPIGSGCDYEYGWTTEIITNAFESIRTLKSVKIPSSVREIGEWAFHNCTALTDVYFDGAALDWITMSVKNSTHCNDPLFRAISHCADDFLISTWGDQSWYLNADGYLMINGSGPMDDFPALASGETDTRAWRPYADRIKNVELFGDITTIGKGAFSNCSNLLSITIPKSVTQTNGAGFLCPSMQYFSVDSENTVYMDIDGVLFDKSGERLMCYPAARSDSIYAIPEGVKQIDSFAFYNNGALITVVIPSSTETINAGAFAYCKNLQQINLPSSVTIIGNMAFYNCRSLSSIRIPSGVTEIEAMTFSYCTNLTEVSIPDSVTSISNAFDHCTSLKHFVVPNGITKIENMTFQGCTGLESVRIPLYITNIGIFAFDSCDSLRDVYYDGPELIWNTIKIENYNSGIGSQAVKHFAAEPDLVLPAALETIEDEAFAGGTFSYVVLPENTDYIGRNAFAYCTNLKYIYIPNSNASIDPYAFADLWGWGPTIIGKEGSTAQTFARQHDFPFIAVG